MPPHDADPSAVRHYLAQVLYYKCNIPIEEAKDIAANWQYGQGSALTYFDIDTFRAIFGGEAGALLHHHVVTEEQILRSPTREVSEKETNMENKDLFGMSPGGTLPIF